MNYLSNRTRAVRFLICLLIILTGCFIGSRDGDSEGTVVELMTAELGSTREGKNVNGDLPDAHVSKLGKRASGFALVPSLRSYDKDSMSQDLAWGGSETRGFTLTVSNYDKATQIESKYSYDAAFEITAVGSQTKDVFYVASETQAGVQVIEQWLHVPKKVQPTGGPMAYRMKRKEIFLGTSLGFIERLQVDPFGQFLVLGHFDTCYRISQMDLNPGFAVTELLGANESYLLNDRIETITRAEHAVEGLLWTIWLETPNYAVVVLRDSNADGLLDDWMAYDYAQMSTFYPPNMTALPWVNDFVRYPSDD